MMQHSNRRLPRVVVVGAGFGGLEAAKTLRRAPVELTIVDRQNHHCFQPLLYQVATAALSPADVAWPIRHIFASRAWSRRTGSVFPTTILSSPPGPLMPISAMTNGLVSRRD
jgi:NADH dehydrogenase FAD-containing subunit